MPQSVIVIHGLTCFCRLRSVFVLDYILKPVYYVYFL